MKQLIRDYLVELKNSPLKSGAIAVLLAVGLLLWGRLLLKEVPRTASAWKSATQIAEDNAKAEHWKNRGRGRLVVSAPSPLTRDLFKLDPSRYRRTQFSDEGLGGVNMGGLASEEAMREAVVSAARELNVQSVIEGEELIVIINRKVLRAGDSIDGFTVLKIESRNVILERLGVRVRLGL